ncbi:cell division protein ZapD [Pantoea sp. Mhis]|uniref:cell division protein ZapD n=1 Tax=Pantoea sp. Mhis TaxID=2576759 RepID=UPI00135AB264|nr:cell division protein ZapD [Pantoea sp. Mhis]MXP56503.1 cell division protein ZapD [Pantoea sp. Mhis]
MNTIVLFEHPLNEKMRTWLRVEFLMKQLYEIVPVRNVVSVLSIFRILSDLLDIFERGDLRSDLLKELERQQQKLYCWINVPGVDKKLVHQLQERLKQQSNELINVVRIGQQLREERLISLVRHRLNIPGGCCSFDLPNLHIWLHQEESLRDVQIKSWLASLNPVYNSLSTILELIRQSGMFRQQTSLNGFYQNNAEGSDLLRLQLTLEDALYPQVSGHKNRYAIRFLPIDTEVGEIPTHLDFVLACC